MEFRTDEKNAIRYSDTVYEKHLLSGKTSVGIGCEYSSNYSAIIYRLGEERVR